VTTEEIREAIQAHLEACDGCDVRLTEFLMTLDDDAVLPCAVEEA